MYQQKALHMRATRTFKDENEVTRKNGEEWLITMKDTEAHIPNVYEEVSKKTDNPPMLIKINCLQN